MKQKPIMNETIKLSDLQPDERNANRGTERGTYMIRQSLQKLGAGRSILLDKNGKVIAGNKTLESAADIGLDDVLIVRTRGDQLVAVMREDLDLDDPEGQARQLAYADNRAGQVSLEWDAGVLSADIASGVDLSDWFHSDELDSVLGMGERDASAIPVGTPEQKISPELFERHDYIVFYIDNEMDWNYLKSRFSIETIESAPVGKRTLTQRGQGRLLPASRLIEELGGG